MGKIAAVARLATSHRSNLKKTGDHLLEPWLPDRKRTIKIKDSKPALDRGTMSVRDFPLSLFQTGEVPRAFPV